MPFDPTASAMIRLTTIAQLAPLGRWQLELAHDRSEHLLLWITRGQGVALFDGARSGLGVHNAIYLPARSLMSFDLGRQCYGQALSVPPGTAISLPERPLHLRVRDVQAQTELTSLFEAMGREQTSNRPLSQTALEAYGKLAAVWLRRHMDSDQPTRRVLASRKLSRAFCARLVSEFGSGMTMAAHAAALGVTPTHLTRVCKAETGKTASELLTERVLHAARQLLTSTEAPVQDVARHLGFGSAAYFTRFVQQHTGRPPTALRKAAA